MVLCVYVCMYECIRVCVYIGLMSGTYATVLVAGMTKQLSMMAMTYVSMCI